ncbi:hypothetical protein POF50_034285 [Streptomyces sp. SL13]|uniref:Uncharacterized protein n=1 Tax=Streptantibioticus silvisoli TaxID=2705255 RepID=A0AA90HCY1_9ACTN|nr:hypothetical protein [Streptantibioticus silvisoli]MDI5966372.1 hypothetical protein [Streptantibioticus silvisoli]MDI5974359.1 hypothetical protein [Streptantibioticus silvisoli]
MSELNLSTDALRHSLVELLMGIIGSPDDEELARTADRAVLSLDERLAGEARTATA